jgi:hypothetical protein
MLATVGRPGDPDGAGRDDIMRQCPERRGDITRGFAHGWSYGCIGRALCAKAVFSIEVRKLGRGGVQNRRVVAEKTRDLVFRWVRKVQEVARVLDRRDMRDDGGLEPTLNSENRPGVISRRGQGSEIDSP